jgi:hypothetical protein
MYRKAMIKPPSKQLKLAVLECIAKKHEKPRFFIFFILRPIPYHAAETLYFGGRIYVETRFAFMVRILNATIL